MVLAEVSLGGHGNCLLPRAPEFIGDRFPMSVLWISWTGSELPKLTVQNVFCGFEGIGVVLGESRV